MKENKKRNVKLLTLGAIILAILVVEVVVLIALTVAYGKENKGTDIRKSRQVQSVLAEIENEGVKGLFFSMFSLENYDVNDFLT